MTLARNFTTVCVPDFKAQLGSRVIAFHRLDTEMHGLICVRRGREHDRLFQQYTARYQFFNEATQHTAEEKPVSNCSAEVGSGGELRVGMYWIVITTQACKTVEVRLAKRALERNCRRCHQSQLPEGLSSRCFWIFPAAVRGKSSTGMNWLGTL